jgi:ribosome-associated protein
MGRMNADQITDRMKGDMLQITDELAIDESELTYNFIRASGPGGQHVNKTATAVQLRFDVAHASSLPEDVRERLLELGGHRITKEGELIIEAGRFRSRRRNHRDATRRLVKLIRRASQPPKERHKTQPPPEADERRLRDKRHRSRVKRLRQPPREW